MAGERELSSSSSSITATCVVLVALILNSAFLCNGGITSSYVRAVFAPIDMPYNSDVFAIPPGYIAPEQYNTKYYNEFGVGNTTRQFYFTTPPLVGLDVPYTFGLIDIGIPRTRLLQIFDDKMIISFYLLNKYGSAIDPKCSSHWIELFLF
ncbi:hypothetical protein NE237_026635 [Protea cynaroides]|uniref:Uncharacterized protein n=1 Tax=Protea cynaroides TaxID=273540 RepID=A0A9Q0K0P4_9MAGN|nr:hypothetical protein NE237_026635 [Protea cynaroides]